MMLTLMLPLAACHSFVSHAPLPITAQRTETDKLKLHPQFKAAAQAAPDFVKEAFHTINRLETDVANGGHTK